MRRAVAPVRGERASDGRGGGGDPFHGASRGGRRLRGAGPGAEPAFGLRHPGRAAGRAQRRVLRGGGEAPSGRAPRRRRADPPARGRGRSGRRARRLVPAAALGDGGRVDRRPPRRGPGGAGGRGCGALRSVLRGLLRPRGGVGAGRARGAHPHRGGDGRGGAVRGGGRRGGPVSGRGGRRPHRGGGGAPGAAGPGPSGGSRPALDALVREPPASAGADGGARRPVGHGVRAALQPPGARGAGGLLRARPDLSRSGRTDLRRRQRCAGGGGGARRAGRRPSRPRSYRKGGQPVSRRLTQPGRACREGRVRLLPRRRQRAEAAGDRDDRAGGAGGRRGLRRELLRPLHRRSDAGRGSRRATDSAGGRRRRGLAAEEHDSRRKRALPARRVPRPRRQHRGLRHRKGRRGVLRPRDPRRPPGGHRTGSALLGPSWRDRAQVLAFRPDRGLLPRARSLLAGAGARLPGGVPAAAGDVHRAVRTGRGAVARAGGVAPGGD